ncbi:MAG: cytochrome c [Bacteroidota bacterium]
MRSLIFVAAVIIIIISCRSKADVEFDQYYNQGEILYTSYCANCHQKDGSGLALLYPPLNKSDFMDNNLEQVLCIMRSGKTTPTVVNGKTFVQPMRGVAALTDLDIAEIATYIYNTWDHKRGIITVNEVTGKMKSCE